VSSGCFHSASSLYKLIFAFHSAGAGHHHNRTLAYGNVTDSNYRVLRVKLPAGELIGPADPDDVFDAGKHTQFVGQFREDLPHHADDCPLGAAGRVAA
jgi:hypothetical protein